MSTAISASVSPPLGLDGPRRDGLLLNSATRISSLDSLLLESGERLNSVQLGWRSWGALSARRDNVVLVCHALTGNANVDEWWPELLGPGRAFDPGRDFVVCANVLGGCSGSTGPLDRGPDASRWGGRFPRLTVRDQVQAEAALLASLGVRRVALVAGGSMGGMRALEWLVDQPLPVDGAVVVAAPAAHSPWAIGQSAAQRAAIEADPRWEGGLYGDRAGPTAGLAAARRAAMLAYRSYPSLADRFGRNGSGSRFAVEDWLDHHGAALVARFDAASYVGLTHTMDTHDVGRGRGGVTAALARVQAPTLVVGITSDGLYPLDEVRAVAARIGPATFEVLDSVHGHDGFLIDQARVGGMVDHFRRRIACQAA